MPNDKRAEFEAWAQRYFHLIWNPARILNGPYERSEIELAWQGWQAHAESVAPKPRLKPRHAAHLDFSGKNRLKPAQKYYSVDFDPEQENQCLPTTDVQFTAESSASGVPVASIGNSLLNVSKECAKKSEAESLSGAAPTDNDLAEWVRKWFERTKSDWHDFYIPWMVLERS